MNDVREEICFKKLRVIERRRKKGVKDWNFVMSSVVALLNISLFSFKYIDRFILCNFFFVKNFFHTVRFDL